MTEQRPELDDKPPVLGSWRNLYAVELAILVALIAFFWFVTQYYALVGGEGVRY